jgi:hypothetical protein
MPTQASLPNRVPNGIERDLIDPAVEAAEVANRADPLENRDENLVNEVFALDVAAENGPDPALDPRAIKPVEDLGS